jgi:signal transduction histidine kinase
MPVYAIALLLLVAQTALIAAFVVQRARCRRAELALGRSESDLRASHRELSNLARRLITAREAERAHVARELHDDLSQKLALLSIDVDLLASAGAPLEFTAQARAISRRVGSLATDLHNFSHQLHPSSLETLGLIAAVHNLCHELSAQHNLTVDFTHEEVPGALPPEIALGIFRIVQEALHNVVKHSGATSAEVHLSASGSALQLRIADPGVGFGLNAAAGSGLGLVSMRERVRMLGGQLAIHTTPGTGTRIGVRVPIQRQDPARHSLAAKSA